MNDLVADRHLRIATIVLMALCLAGFTACSKPDPGWTESTDLYVVDIWADSGLFELGSPDRITDRDGYDNQPSFSRDGRSILFVSREGRESDIHRYDLESESIERITSTGDREYSPISLPDGEGFSAVRAERSGARRIWKYDNNGENTAALFTMIERPVLYYDWIDEDVVAAVLERSSGARGLYVAALDGDGAERIADDVGRSVQRIPGRRAVSFVHKESPSDWWIREFDAESGEVVTVARTLQGVEDHAWTPGGAVLMASGSKLFLWVPGGSGQWEPIGEFAKSGVKGITRLAVSPSGDSIVLVADRNAN